MSFPSIILALLLLVVMGAGLETVIMLLRSLEYLVTKGHQGGGIVRQRDCIVEPARAIGASPKGVYGSTYFSADICPLIVVATTSLGGAIFTEAPLSFLDLEYLHPHQVG
ncbi:MAG: hypothetical protein CM1200mP3_04790 [Chloroflexota bacterium]|nr:MAG: hypothetical protein CM1200mP3_04790 [Chloroflexota bacterium]